jgi:hypothetical protein
MAGGAAVVSVNQPFAVGDRIVVVANEHDQRETLTVVGHTGRVCQVYPYPIDRIVDCGALLDGESEPRRAAQDETIAQAQGAKRCGTGRNGAFQHHRDAAIGPDGGPRSSASG